MGAERHVPIIAVRLHQVTVAGAERPVLLIVAQSVLDTAWGLAKGHWKRPPNVWAVRRHAQTIVKIPVKGYAVTIVMWGVEMGVERFAPGHVKNPVETAVMAPVREIVLKCVQTTVQIAAGTGVRGARGAVDPAKIYVRGAEAPVLRAARGARGAATSVIRHVNSHASGAMGARGAQGARIPARMGAETPVKTSAETTVKAHVMARLLRQFINYKIYHKIRRNTKMKLILKDKREIKIDAVNNRCRLKKVDGKSIAPTISLHIFNADPAITMDSIVDALRDGNTTGFEVAYSDTETAKFEGWELSDVAEEITDNHRVITIIAMKIEAAA